MGYAAKLWAAGSMSVGPSPPLAPGVLAQVGLCALLAALRPRRAGPVNAEG